jgi:membrane protease YdiL (CAAX protease family)
MKAFANCLFIFTSLFVLLWPLALIASVFAFDAPAKSTTYELVNVGAVILLLTYPWGYLAALRARWRARKSGEDWHTPRNVIFLLLPFLQIASLFVIGYFYGNS